MSTVVDTSEATAEAPRGGLRGFLGRHRAALYAFVASRLALFAVGLMTQIFIEPFSSRISPLQLTDSAALRMWGQWDTGWYVSLATAGYALQPGADGQVNWVFFPAFPMLSAALAQVTGLDVFPAMLVVSNASFLAALFLIHRFAREEFDPRTADLTVALICAAPGSYIFSSAYTESLFLLGLAGCLLMLRGQRWLAAGGFAALTALTRNLGVGLLLPFAFAAAPAVWALGQGLATGQENRRRLLGEGVRIAVGIALPLLALAGFCLFLYLHTGDPLAFATAQKAWGRSLHLPGAWAVGPLLVGDLPENEVISFAAMWLALSLVAALALMRRWSLFVLAAFLTLIPMSTGLTSFARYCLVALPLFLAGARLLAPRPAAAGAVLIVFATLNGFLMAAWTLCLWVTA